MGSDDLKQAALYGVWKWLPLYGPFQLSTTNIWWQGHYWVPRSQYLKKTKMTDGKAMEMDHQYSGLPNDVGHAVVGGQFLFFSDQKTVTVVDRCATNVTLTTKLAVIRPSDPAECFGEFMMSVHPEKSLLIVASTVKSTSPLVLVSMFFLNKTCDKSAGEWVEEAKFHIPRSSPLSLASMTSSGSVIAIGDSAALNDNGTAAGRVVILEDSKSPGFSPNRQPFGGERPCPTIMAPLDEKDEASSLGTVAVILISLSSTVAGVALFTALIYYGFPNLRTPHGENYEADICRVTLIFTGVVVVVSVVTFLFTIE